MAKPILPANPFISEFDFKQVFDLTDGTLKISLLTQSIQNAMGITGVKLEVITPANVKIAPASYIFTSNNFFTTYNVMLPRAANTFVFGIYKTRLTLILSGKEYPNQKDFNLCAIDSNEPLRLDGKGFLQVVTDCARRVLKVGGFTGYTYKQQSPSSEDKNITVWYPTQSEKLPQKNISVVPFEVEARNGEYVIKGANVSTYTFPDETYVKVKWVSEVSKKVRCGTNMTAIFQALNSVFGAGGSGVNDCDLWCKVGPLIAMIQLGMNSGIDISEHVERLETILKVDCGCSDLGQLVDDNVIPICPQVSDASATVNGFNMLLKWNSQGIPSTSNIQIEYRPKASAPNGMWTQLNPSIPATGGVQQISLSVFITGQYEVQFKVVSGNNSCPPLTISSNVPVASDCVDIIDIVGISSAGAASGTTQPATTTVPGGGGGTDTIYYMAKTGPEVPTASEILSSASTVQQNASGDITVDLKALTTDYSYFTIAWPNKGAAYLKNQWVENPIENFGNIGGPENLFGDLVPILIGGQPYVMITNNFATKFTSTQNPLTLKKT